MCDISTESQLCPGLHQKKCRQQVEGGVSAPVLHSHKIPPRVLHPALVSATQERCESVVGGPEEGHVDAQWDGTLLLGRLSEVAGVVQPGKERDPSRPSF